MNGRTAIAKQTGGGPRVKSRGEARVCAGRRGIRLADLTSNKIYPFIKFPEIKVFLPNGYITAGHVDTPPMTIGQVFWIVPLSGGIRMDAKPDVLLIVEAKRLQHPPQKDSVPASGVRA